MSFQTRLGMYQELATLRNSTVLACITGHRPDLAAILHDEIIPFFVDHLDTIRTTERISLYLHTTGGSITAAWTLSNLLRYFCDTLEVIVPYKALSAGTLLCLGADQVVMTKQASLGPIDPSLQNELTPRVPVPGGQKPVQVSVEAINGYVEFLRASLGEQNASAMAPILENLATQIHPLVLGEAFRQRAHIRMIGKRLLSRQVADLEKAEKVLAFLCGDSGNHSYTIFRREAKDELGLNVQKPGEDGYRTIKAIYDDFAAEMFLDRAFPPPEDVGSDVGSAYEWEVPRAFIESVAHGSHAFTSVLRSDKKSKNTTAEATGWTFSPSPKS